MATGCSSARTIAARVGAALAFLTACGGPAAHAADLGTAPPPLVDFKAP
jgi:hypothetical protein